MSVPVGSRGWVSFRDSAWESCELLDQTDKHLSLKLDSGNKTIERAKCKFFLRNPDNVEAIDDFLLLPYLDEPNILHSLV
jgi:hypothetical protein